MSLTNTLQPNVLTLDTSGTFLSMSWIGEILLLCLLGAMLWTIVKVLTASAQNFTDKPLAMSIHLAEKIIDCRALSAIPLCSGVSAAVVE